MKKLELGDYVTNLTEKQFDNILKHQPKYYLGYSYSKGQTDTLFMNDGFIDFPWKEVEVELKTELTYRQFILRLKNTF